MPSTRAPDAPVLAVRGYSLGYRMPGGVREALCGIDLEIAQGEVVVVNERFGVRLTEVVSPSERIKRLR